MLTLAEPGASGSLGAAKNLVIDGSVPFVTGITRLDANPNSSFSVRFQVTFSESVTGFVIMPLSLRFTRSTCSACSMIERFL